VQIPPPPPPPPPVSPAPAPAAVRPKAGDPSGRYQDAGSSHSNRVLTKPGTSTRTLILLYSVHWDDAQQIFSARVNLEQYYRTFEALQQVDLLESNASRI
jgi:hypothetical protein